MKIGKKLVGLVLTLVLALNLCTGVNCTVVNAADYVARVSVVSCTYETGHAFIVVENKSSSSITVGQMSLGAGKLVTLGTFGSLASGQCLYYNAEKYRMLNDVFDYTPNVCLQKYITSDELKTLTKVINANTNWTLTGNCVSFAEKCWNSISDDDISVVRNLPSVLASKIKEYSYGTNLSITGSCSSSDVYYQKNSTTKNSASLEDLNILSSIAGSLS